MLKKGGFLVFITFVLMASASFFIQGCANQSSANNNLRNNVPSTSTSPVSQANTPVNQNITGNNTNNTNSSSGSPKWNLVGKYVISSILTSTGGVFKSDFSITNQTGNIFSGTGGYPAGSPTYLKQDNISGTIASAANGPITMHYTEVGDNYFNDMTGTIDSAGNISGTWKDSNGSTGTFSMSGTATKVSGP